MMRPKIVDVIEYVKAGEDDPTMGRMLRRDPDGPELLKQARFICKVLEHRSESAEDGGRTVRFDFVPAARSEVMREPSRRMSMDLGPAVFHRMSRSRSISDMIFPYGAEPEDLGTLEFAEEGEAVAVSYQPTAMVLMRYGKTSDAFELAQANIDGLEVRGRDITFTLPDRLPAGQPASLRVTRGLKRLPVPRFDLTFMPDSGPFDRIAAGVKGLAQLPVPDQSGTMLITTADQSKLLHIKLKK